MLIKNDKGITLTCPLRKNEMMMKEHVFRITKISRCKKKTIHVSPENPYTVTEIPR